MYKFSELDAVAKQHAYDLYCAAMDDDLNRDDILSPEDYEAEADYIDLMFDADGNVV